MLKSRSRAAVSPLRRRFDAPAEAPLPRVDDVVRRERPDEPIHCLRPAVLDTSARTFVEAFPGDVLYAVKCNPEPRVLRALWAGGVRHFDCASAAEVALVRQMFPDAVIHFMHPVKTRAAIREAYRHHGVRDFVLDSAEELAKILEEARPAAARGAADDLGLFVRLALPRADAARAHALYELAGKFGAELAVAADLLRAARPHARTLGIAFHVGSQCMEPLAYARAIAWAGEAVRLAGVEIDAIDVGGGFPVSYPDITPPPLGAYLAEIEGAVERLGFARAPRLMAEPGRALVAAGTSVVVQVLLRRGRALYVTDGVYGSLSDAGVPGFRFPVRLIREAGMGASEELESFELYGPTCDSADHMKGPFLLPADIRDGDWIELGQLGAYGAALRTAFNGFDRARLVDVVDPPLLATPGYATAFEPAIPGVKPAIAL